MWSSLRNEKTTAVVDKRGFVSGSKISNSAQVLEDGDRSLQLLLYNDAYYSSVKLQYTQVIQSVTDFSKASKQVLESSVKSLQEICARVSPLLPSNNDLDLPITSNSYTSKWRQLLYLVQKMILKYESLLRTLSLKKKTEDQEEESYFVDEADSPFHTKKYQEKKKQLYLLAVENFELMLDLNDETNSPVDLVMIQLLLFWSKECYDYWTFQQILHQYAPTFNKFYSKYIQEQWELLGSLPSIHSADIMAIESSNTEKTKLSDPAVTTPFFNLEHCDKGISFYLTILDYLRGKGITSNFFQEIFDLILKGKLVNEVEAERMEVDEDPDESIEERSYPRRMPTRNSGSALKGDDEENSNINDDLATSEVLLSKFIENRFKPAMSIAVDPILGKFENFIHKLADNNYSSNVKEYFESDALKTLVPLDFPELAIDGDQVEDISKNLEDSNQNLEDRVPEDDQQKSEEILIQNQDLANAELSSTIDKAKFEAFLTYINRMIDLLNRSIQSKPPNDLLLLEEFLIVFILSSNELIRLTFNNYRFYTSFIQNSKGSNDLFQNYLNEVVIDVLVYLINHQTSPNFSIFNLFPSFLIGDELMKKNQESHFLLLIKEVCLYHLLHEKDVDHREVVEFLLRQLLNYEMLPSLLKDDREFKLDYNARIRNEWSVVLYLTLQSNKMMQSSTVETSKQSQKKKKKSKRTKKRKEEYLSNAELYDQIPKFLSILRETESKIVYYHNLNQTEGSASPVNEGEVKNNDEKSEERKDEDYFYFLPHLSRQYYHLLTPTIIKSVLSKLSKTFESEYAIYESYIQQKEHQQLQSDAFSAPSSLSSSSSPEDLGKWIDEIILQNPLNWSGIASTNPSALLRSFLFNIEMNEKIENFVLSKALIKTSLELKSLKRVRKNSSNTDEVMLWQGRWKNLYFIFFHLLNEVLRLLNLKQQVIEDSGSSNTADLTAAMKVDLSMYSRLVEYWNFLQRQHRVTFRTLSLSEDERKKQFHVLKEMLSLLFRGMLEVEKADEEKNLIVLAVKNIVKISRELKPLFLQLLTSPAQNRLEATEIENEDERLVNELMLTSLWNHIIFFWFQSCKGLEVKSSPSIQYSTVLIDYLISLIDWKARVKEGENEISSHLAIKIEELPVNLCLALIISSILRLRQTISFDSKLNDSEKEQAGLLTYLPFLLSLLVTNCKVIRVELEKPKLNSSSSNSSFVHRIEILRYGVDLLLRYSMDLEQGDEEKILSAYELLLSEFISPVLKRANDPNGSNQTAFAPVFMIKDAYLLLAKIYSELYSMPLTFASANNENNDDGSEEDKDTESAMEDSESQTTDTNDDSEDDASSRSSRRSSGSSHSGSKGKSDRKKRRKRKILMFQGSALGTSDAEEVYNHLLKLKTFYTFIEYGYDMKMILKGEIRDVLYWILLHLTEVAKSTPMMQQKTSYNCTYFSMINCFFSREDNRTFDIISYADIGALKSQAKALKDCGTQLVNFSYDHEGSTDFEDNCNKKCSDLQNSMISKIYLQIHELSLPLLEILPSSTLKIIRSSIFTSRYYEDYEIPTFHLLLDQFPFLRVLLDLPEPPNSKKKGSTKAIETDSDDNDEEGDREDIAHEDEEEADEEKSKNRSKSKEKKEYNLFVEERVFYYMMLLQRHLLHAKQLGPKPTEDEISNLFEVYYHVFQYLFSIRQRLNDMIHERVLYSHTKSFLHRLRKKFYDNYNGNTSRVNFFDFIGMMKSSDLLTTNAASSSSSLPLYPHGDNTSCFWIFHSYFLQNVFTSYVEEFYSFLEQQKQENDSTDASFTHPATNNSLLEQWFINSKAKDVFYFQLIPSSTSLHSSVSTSSSLIYHHLPDNNQFIKSILFLDYCISILETFLHQIYQLLRLYYENFLSMRSAPSANEDIAGSEKEDSQQQPEMTEKYLEIVELYSLYLINELNNYEIEPSIKSGLNRDIYEALVTDDYHHRSLFALVMAPRLRFHLSNTPIIAEGLSKEKMNEMVDNLHHAYDIHRIEEKNLSKKERLSFLYYHFTLLYSIVYSLLQVYYSQKDDNSEDNDEDDEEESILSMHSEDIKKLFHVYFPLSNHQRHCQLNYEMMWTKSLSVQVISLSEALTWKDEDRLWLLLCFSIRQMLEIRKKDSYHFQTQFRLAMMTHEMLGMKEHFPQWISDSFLPISSSSTNKEENTANLIDPTTPTIGSAISMDQEETMMEVDLSQSSINQAEVGLEVELETDEVMKVEEEKKDTLEEEDDVESYDVEEETKLNVIVQANNEELSSKVVEIVHAQSILRLHNPLLLSFLTTISPIKAFNEMHKLFERRYPQIIAMWHDQIPDNPWEKIIAQASEFDALRRKITKGYLDLGRNYLQDFDPQNIYPSSNLTAASSMTPKNNKASGSITAEATKLPDFLLSLLRYLLECKNVIFTATVHDIFHMMLSYSADFYQIIFQKYREKLMVQCSTALQTVVSSSLSLGLGKISAEGKTCLVALGRSLIDQLLLIVKDLEGVYKFYLIVNSKRFMVLTSPHMIPGGGGGNDGSGGKMSIQEQLRKMFEIFINCLFEIQQFLKKLITFIPITSTDVTTPVIPALPSSSSSSLSTLPKIDDQSDGLSSAEKELLGKFIAITLKNPLPTATVTDSAVGGSEIGKESENDETLNQDKMILRQYSQTVQQILSQVKRQKTPAVVTSGEVTKKNIRKRPLKPSSSAASGNATSSTSLSEGEGGVVHDPSASTSNKIQRR